MLEIVIRLTRMQGVMCAVSKHHGFRFDVVVEMFSIGKDLGLKGYTNAQSIARIIVKVGHNFQILSCSVMENFT